MEGNKELLDGAVPRSEEELEMGGAAVCEQLGVEKLGVKSAESGDAVAAPSSTDLNSMDNQHLSVLKRKVQFLGLCFLLLFTAFMVTQSLVTTLFGKQGSFGVAALYACFGIASLLAPSLCQMLGERNSFVVAAATYVFFCVAINLRNVALFYAGCVVSGFGAGVLWIQQGLYLSSVAQVGGTIGYFTGVFFLIHGISGVLGNLVALTALQVMDTSAMLWLMVSVSVLATILYGFVTSSKDVNRWTLLVGGESPVLPAAQGSTAPQQASKSQLLRQATSRYLSATGVVLHGIWDALQEKRTLLFVPSMFQQGFGLAMTVALLPVLRKNTSADVATIFLVYSLCGAVMSRLLGKLWDLVGWSVLIVSNLSAALIFCVINLYSLSQGETELSLGLCILNGVLSACVDLGANSLVNMTISQFYPKRVSAMFGLYRALMSLGVVVGSLCAGATGKSLAFTLHLSFAVLAAFTYALGTKAGLTAQ